jgi:hypothetical protein
MSPPTPEDRPPLRRPNPCPHCGEDIAVATSVYSAVRHSVKDKSPSAAGRGFAVPLYSAFRHSVGGDSPPPTAGAPVPRS